MIKRSHIRQFLAVVDAGSFTHAAARIRVTQPTLSVGISELEKIVGITLIVRDRRHLRLTEAGGRFLPIARSLESHFREADSFGEVKRADWPEIKLGLIKTLPASAVQAMVESIARSFSLEIVEGTDSELRAALSDGRLNLMVGLLRSDETEPSVIELADEPYLMLIPANHHLAGLTLVQPAQLAAEVMIARRSCEILNETSRFFTRHQVRPRFSFRSDSDDRCLQMVAAGLGITTAPASLLAAGTSPLVVTGYDFRRRVGVRFGSDMDGVVREKLWLASEAYVAIIRPIVNTALKCPQCD